MDNGTFPKSFKISEVISVYKKKMKHMTKVSTKLPTHKYTFKSIQIYERYLHDEINVYLDILSKFQTTSINAVVHNIACCLRCIYEK